ncbi:MAG: Dabb family protein, partial [Gammaproteobacteria bacterium]|nr:Dabb family protein [Gammaproteobacteria bacterium]
MIRHLVFYKFKPEITDTQITALFQKLSLLKEKVPGIIALHWGRSLNQANTAGFTYALSVDLESESVFKEYSPHPL